MIQLITRLVLLHALQVVRYVKVRVRLLPDFCHLHARRQFGQRQLAIHAVDLKHALPLSDSNIKSEGRRMAYQVCDDGANAVCPRQR